VRLHLFCDIPAVMITLQLMTSHASEDSQPQVTSIVKLYEELLLHKAWCCAVQRRLHIAYVSSMKLFHSRHLFHL
jgi:hypothetical protein